MDDKLEKNLLEKMLRKRIIGSKHIRYENIISCIAFLLLLYQTKYSFFSKDSIAFFNSLSS